MGYKREKRKHTLYATAFGHDAWGVGTVAGINGMASPGVADDVLTNEAERLE